MHFKKHSPNHCSKNAIKQKIRILNGDINNLLSAILSRLRGWSCPEEEVLNSSHAMPQQRGLALLTGTATSHRSSALPHLQLKVRSICSRQYGRSRPPSLCFCPSKTAKPLLSGSGQLRHQLVVSWFIFQDGKIPLKYEWTHSLVFRFPREE